MKRLSLLCIGDELLDGRIADANGLHIAALSSPAGWSIEQIRLVGDNRDQIRSCLEDLAGVDAVVVSGGLGPTGDDVTREAAADFLGVDLVEEQSVLESLRRRFEERNRPFTDNNRRQCAFPEGADILANEVGTAPGFRFDHLGTQYFFFPGVPHEFRWLTEKYLCDQFATSDGGDLHRRLLFFGLGESDLETRIADLYESSEIRSQSVRLGLRAHFPIIEVSLKGDRAAVDVLEKRILRAIGPWLVGEDDEDLSARTGRRLVEAEATVSVVESCTAGLLGATLTEVSGSSRYFHEGYLTYSNEAKQRLVDVTAQTLKRHGAVSRQTAMEMALGAQRRSGADYALAITGIAGPTGGTPDKPVGTVHFAMATGDCLLHRRDVFANRTRREVRILSVHRSLALLLWHLEGRLDGRATEIEVG